MVHLAGEPIAARWTAAVQAPDPRLRRGTKNLARALSQAKETPPALISASATGYYGDRGDETLTEESASGIGFLAEVCRRWESATESALAAGVVVIHLRLGLVRPRDFCGSCCRFSVLVWAARLAAGASGGAGSISMT